MINPYSEKGNVLYAGTCSSAKSIQSRFSNAKVIAKNEEFGRRNREVQSLCSRVGSNDADLLGEHIHKGALSDIITEEDSSVGSNQPCTYAASSNGNCILGQHADRFSEPAMCGSSLLELTNGHPDVREDLVIPDGKLASLNGRKCDVASKTRHNSDIIESSVAPATSGDVLVVTHGGLIRTLLAHFIEDLACKMLVCRDHAVRISPNTGLSYFTVTVDELSHQPSVTCHLMHDSSHLELAKT